MLEYVSDQFRILNSSSSPDRQPSRCYIYRGLDNMLYYTEQPRYPKADKENYYKNQSLYIKFPESDSTHYKYFGMDTPVSSLMDWENNPYIKHSVWISKENDRLADIQLGALDLHYDRIRIYFLRGFSLSSAVGLDGISIKVKSKAVRDVIDGDRKWKEEADVCFLDFFLDSCDFSKVIKRMSTPIYMNSKYYDQYMDVEFPAPYSVALNDHDVASDASDNLFWAMDYSNPDNLCYDIYSVNPAANVMIEFATISSGNTVIEKLEQPIHVLGASMETTQSDIMSMALDRIDTAAYIPTSNSNYFNIKIYEDSTEKCIVYYPTYGDLENQQELDTVIMGRINSGEIPITANGFFDMDNTDLDLNDTDMATDDLYYFNENVKISSKWKIYNDILVAYLYGGNTGNDSAYTESYSRIIDYANDLNSDLKFWRTRFVPNTHIINTLGVKDICIKYTCRLVNAMRGIEVVRIASLTVSADRYTENIANVLNIRQMKIVNKISQTPMVNIQQQETVKERYIRSYYNATQLVAKNIGTGGSVYSQGQMTLRLYRTNNNYMIQLFNITDDNIRVPYDMTGPYKYKLVFPLSDGTKMTISPNSDSAKQNLGIGMLVFYITGEQASNIMRVPDSDRYFAVMTDVGKTAAQETTLYQGKVEWLE